MEKRRNESRIFDQRGDISAELKEYLRKSCADIPTLDNTNNWYFDWNIIGKQYETWFGFDQHTKPEFLDFKTWVNSLKPMREWINWVSINIFYPKTIIYSTHLTDRVKIRIAVSKLNKLELPKQQSNEIFDNLIYTWQCRKVGYSEFYYKVIEELPF